MTSPVVPPAAQRTFEVEVLLIVRADDDAAARKQADVILQRAWDTDHGRHYIKGWHFEMLPDGLVTDVTEDAPPPEDVIEAETTGRRHGKLCAVCRVSGHDACSMTVGCPCCESSIEHLGE